MSLQAVLPGTDDLLVALVLLDPEHFFRLGAEPFEFLVNVVSTQSIVGTTVERGYRAACIRRISFR